MIVAIDGPAASGKGTLARRVADHYGLPVLDTGALYRAVARDVVRSGFRIHDVWAAVAIARGLDHTTLDDPALRERGVGENASIIAKIPEVRTALLSYQRAFARRPGGAVLDGRDIGTIVCPDADIKIFVFASAEVRAQRRFQELSSRGEDVSFQGVLDTIRNRDRRDKERTVAPLRPAEDAYLLDSTDLDIDGAFNAAVEFMDARMHAGGLVKSAP